ncbi:Ff.00g032170.m01.CDS01 [Fusarium sp. VM40]|nr:Ff.00g032170.m01.CDS01 [Fusarium sp. VM40]
MSDSTSGKTNAWTEEAKNELLLRIIAQLKPEGKGINWSEIHMEGRTVKSLQNQWTAFNKKMEAYKHGSTDGSTPSTPMKRTPARKRTPKAKKADSEDEEEYGSQKKVTPRKRRATKTETPENAAKAVKMELSDAIIKDEMDEVEDEYDQGEA